MDNSEAEAKWRWLLENPPEGLADFVRMAAEVPELRALYPFTTYEWLCFSTMSGYPHAVDGPRVRPLDGKIEVWLYRQDKDKLLGCGNASQALVLVIGTLERV